MGDEWRSIFPPTKTGMLQNGGSSGAPALWQEMNSDIRAMDLGAPTASWEIMASRRETTHVISWKRHLQNFRIKKPRYNLTSFTPVSSRLKFPKWFIADNIWSKQSAVCTTQKFRVARSGVAWHPPDWLKSQCHSFIPGRWTSGGTIVKEWHCSCGGNSFGVPLP